jgi:hypothetical protein
VAAPSSLAIDASWPCEGAEKSCASQAELSRIGDLEVILRQCRATIRQRRRRQGQEVQPSDLFDNEGRAKYDGNDGYDSNK